MANQLIEKDGVKDLTLVFNNSFTSEVIQDLTAQEKDLLMAVLSVIKRKGSVEVPIYFSDIKLLFNRPTMGNSTIAELSYSLWRKVKVVDYVLYAFGKPSGGVPLFSFWGVDEKKLSLNVQINPALEYFVNSFERGNYSSLLYREFRETKDKYGKTLFLLLSQWKSVGSLTLTKEDLEHKLDVPLSYRENTRLLNDKVIKPAMKSLSELFDNLELEKIKKGRRITHYRFSFTPEERPYKKQKTKKNIPKKTQTSTISDSEYDEMLSSLL